MTAAYVLAYPELTLGYNFSNKWTSSDGLTMWMDFSAGGLDSFNLVKATLTLFRK